MRAHLLLAALIGACGSDARTAIEIHARAGEAGIAEFAEFIPYPALRVVESADPAADAAVAGDAIVVAVEVDGDCAECYRLEAAAGGLVVRGGALGVQYGLANAFELLGFGFFAPWQTLVPDRPVVPDSHPDLGRDQAPGMELRGLHLHTIHPVEAYYAFWEPGEQNLADARRIVDWAMKQRANYIQWVALDSIQQEGADTTAWRAHSRAIVDYAHARGIRVGVAIQLFGLSNLQQGFDLVDDETAAVRPQVAERLPVLLDELAWDRIELSFGEFFGADPDVFIAAVNDAYAELLAQAPGIEMDAVVHAGDSPDQRVDYMGENLIYYFLVKFADPGIIPSIHTVMYYNLFEDAGGAYHHEDFAEHRQYLLDRLIAGETVQYKPETAYWVAFDNSVPTYLPLYIRSRWLDLAEIRAAAAAGGFADLEDHLLFTTGWEWGYWQHDVAALRASWELPDDWRELPALMLAPAGPRGADVAAQVVALAELEHEYLLVRRLTAYLAARDTYIDVGDQIGVVSQPDRLRFHEVDDLDAAARADFETGVVGALESFAAGAAGIAAELAVDPVDAAWYREIADGVEVTALRARYVAALYRAMLGDAGSLDAAVDAVDAAAAVVARRHAALAYPQPDLLLYGTTNATLYQWGYLKQTHELCYWVRERVEVERLLLGSTEPIPSCVF